MSKLTLYECRAKTCSLGTVGAPGQFTGGISAEQKHSLTGQPIEEMKKGDDYGEGVCPNCGTPGKAIGDHNAASKGGSK